MNNENQEPKKSTPFGTFLLGLLAITVVFVVLGGMKQIYDGYKEAERQIELQKQKTDRRRPWSTLYALRYTGRYNRGGAFKPESAWKGDVNKSTRLLYCILVQQVSP